MFVRKCF